MPFGFRTARTEIETALRDQLLLAFGRRLPPVDGIAALAALPSVPASEDDLRYVVAAERTYRFRRAEERTPDGDTIIAPSDLPVGAPGRWLKTHSRVTDGYLERCELYNEDEDEETMIERLLSKRPAILLSFAGARHKPVSNRAGALYWYAASYRLLAVSTNMRGDEAAWHGSPRPAEAKLDPGTAAMLGDAKASLAGSDLGLGGAVERVELGEERPVIVALAKRTVVEALDLTVWATLRADDHSLVPLEGAEGRCELADGTPGEFSDDFEIRFEP
jgi:hypothetical protein